MFVIDEIRNNGIESLNSLYGITVKEYNDHYVLNYSQIDSPKNHPIVNECRALILDKYTLQPSARSFDRFFNLGECDTNIDDISQYAVYEKIDGSLINIWYNVYENRWIASTRKLLNSEGNVGDFEKTFNELIEEALQCSVHEFCVNLNLDWNYTYIFELTSPENRIVTRYTETCLWFLAMRNTTTGYYYNHNKAKELFTNTAIKFPKEYKFTNMNEMNLVIRELPVLEEGYVCVKRQQNIDDVDLYEEYRVKVKNPAYLAVAHLRENGSVSVKRICQLVWENNEEEYLSYFPEDKLIFEPYIEARNMMIPYLTKLFGFFKHITDQKEFALQLKEYSSNPLINSIIFNMKKNENIRTILDRLSDVKKVELLKYIKTINE